MALKVPQVILVDIWGPRYQLTNWGMFEIVCFVTHFWNAMWFPFWILIDLEKKLPQLAVLLLEILNDVGFLLCVSVSLHQVVSNSLFKRALIYYAFS